MKLYDYKHCLSSSVYFVLISEWVLFGREFIVVSDYVSSYYIGHFYELYKLNDNVIIIGHNVEQIDN